MRRPAAAAAAVADPPPDGRRDRRPTRDLARERQEARDVVVDRADAEPRGVLGEPAVRVALQLRGYGRQSVCAAASLDPTSASRPCVS